MNGLTFSSVDVCYENTNQIYLSSVENYKVDNVCKERPFKFNLKRQKGKNQGLTITEYMSLNKSNFIICREYCEKCRMRRFETLMVLV